MKKIFIICSIIFINFSFSQVKEPVHVKIDFKINNLRIIITKSVTHFYIEKEHFKSIRDDTITNESNLEQIKFINFKKFILIAENEKSSTIKRNNGSRIKILTKDKIFDKIYFYKKVKNLFVKYEVVWIEDIE